MAIDRSGTYDENTSPAPTGTEFLTQYGDFVGGLLDTSTLRLASVAGVNAITATAEPFSVPPSGLVAGMKFVLKPANNNTGAVTLNIDARGAQAVLARDGSALAAGALLTSTQYLLYFDGTNFISLSPVSSGVTATGSRTTYDSTAVWTNNIPATTLVMVELWGAGGGGNTATGFDSAGGGGGGYAKQTFVAGDLPATVSITIPAGGAAGATGTDGGNATFGSLLTAYGGAGGAAQAGGGGGGETEAATGGFGGSVGGGSQGDFVVAGTAREERAEANAKTIFGGGAGAASTSSPSAAETRAGNAVFGGGGGGSEERTGGGVSVYGGNGGADNSAGAVPGGGGGGNAAGGGGRCIVTIYGE